MSFNRIILLIAIIVSPASYAPVIMTPAAPLTPNAEHLAILKKGVEVWNAWRAENPNVAPELSGADLTGADLSNVDLRRALLVSADMSEATLSRSILAGADLSWANLSGARVAVADISGANLTCVSLSRADLFRTNLSRTNLVGAHLAEAKLSLANLSEANLFQADLSGSNLVGADLKSAILKSARLKAAIFEPNTVPRARDMLGATGLTDLRIRILETEGSSPTYDVVAIEDLRQDAKRAGLREMERELTCSIERNRNRNPGRPFIARVFCALAFDFTCSYGANAKRPLLLLFAGIAIFGATYSLLFYFGRGGTIFADFLTMRDCKTVTVFITRKKRRFSPLKSRRRRLKLFVLARTRVVRVAFYFSLLSAFNIGYKEFNVGIWLGRLQKRPYTLRARGWLRVASGAQSLLGVYLLALWLVCTFGRPFG